MRYIAALLLVCLCAPAQNYPSNSELLNSTLWVQTSIEHDAVYLALFHGAREQLDRALKDKNWTAAVEQKGDYKKLPPAIILDIDETVLDNGIAQARQSLSNEDYTVAEWNRWVQEAAARPLPGAVEFTQYARSKGVTVFWVTNREKPLKEATRRNMQTAGFPMDAAKGPATDTFLLRGDQPEWQADKGSRRAFVAKDYRILMLLGDDAGDFISNVRVGVDERRKLVEQYKDWWGKKWIPLPNPMYGSWETAIFNHDFRLSRQERLQRKFGTLNPGTSVQKEK